MRKSMVAASLAVASLVFAMGGCEGMQHGGPAHVIPVVFPTHAVAVVYPTKGFNANGKIWFEDVPGGVRVHGELHGLTPNSQHGFHIHMYGDATSDNGSSAGGHYNPAGETHKHGAPNAPMSHAGDLGNVTANGSGDATVDVTIQGISVGGMHNPILGRGIVVHDKVDDLKTDPSGNSGDRIGVGVIGVAKNP